MHCNFLSPVLAILWPNFEHGLASWLQHSNAVTFADVSFLRARRLLLNVFLQNPPRPMPNQGHGKQLHALARCEQNLAQRLGYLLET